MRIVLDTNCLIQSVGYYSPFRKVWTSILQGENTLCVSNEIIEECSEILHRLIGTQFAETVIATILNCPFVELITPYYHFNLIQSDPDDNKFVDCAITANARFIVTNDHHFDVLRRMDFPKVEVMNLDDFHHLLIK